MKGLLHWLPRESEHADVKSVTGRKVDILVQEAPTRDQEGKMLLLALDASDFES